MKATEFKHRPEPREREIQKAAYLLWQELGRPAGREVETWFAAREKLRHRRIASSGMAAPPPTRRRLSILSEQT